MGLPPMGGLPLNMSLTGMMPQQTIQMLGGIMPLSNMMTGTPTQQMGMPPQTLGQMGMQQVGMAAQLTGMGMPPAGIYQPANVQQQTSMTQPADMVAQLGMTQAGIMQPGHVASMPAQIGAGNNQFMPPPPPRSMTQPPMAGLSPGHRT